MPTAPRKIVQYYYHGGKSGGTREGTDLELATFIKLNRSRWASYGFHERAADGKVTPVKLSRPGLSASQMGTTSVPDKSKKVIEDEPKTDAKNCPHCEGQAKHQGNLGTLSHYSCEDCGGEFHTVNEQKKEEKPVKLEGGSLFEANVKGKGVLGNVESGTKIGLNK